ncbi:aminotransferase-like mobile domain-containing protein [Tanacetum coccineum]
MLGKNVNTVDFSSGTNENYAQSSDDIFAAQNEQSFLKASKHTHWTDAMNTEMEALLRNDIWEITDLPKDRKAISSKWVYRIKYKLDENSIVEIEKFKEFLKTKFMIKDLGKLKYLLGIEVIDNKDGICLNKIAETRRFINHMRDEAASARNYISQLTALSTELEAMGDQEDVFDSLMCLRDDQRDENSRLMALNDVIAKAEEKISTKEAHLVYTWLPPEFPVFAHGSFLLLDKLVEVADSPRLQDKMKWVFSQTHSEYESFIGLMHDLCFGLRMSLHKNQRLIDELEALGQRVDALKSLDCLREIVARDSGTLGVLEQLLAGAHVRMGLRNGYVAEMEQSE